VRYIDGEDSGCASAEGREFADQSSYTTNCCLTDGEVRHFFFFQSNE